MTTLGAYSLTYDYENRLSSAANGASVNYYYDGAGQRVQKVFSSGSVTNYVYGAFGDLVAEYATTSPAPSCATCYLSWDHLGSTRMVTDGLGNVVARHDFLAFGDEIPANTMGRSSANFWAATDNVSQKFTGQERDETALDYFDARYFSSAIGRFASPDPLSVGADLSNPQSWNGYAYVANSPLSDVDPDGMADCTLSCVSLGSGGTGTASPTLPGGGTFRGGSSFFGGGPGDIAANFNRGPAHWTGFGRPGGIQSKVESIIRAFNSYFQSAEFGESTMMAGTAFYAATVLGSADVNEAVGEAETADVVLTETALIGEATAAEETEVAQSQSAMVSYWSALRGFAGPTNKIFLARGQRIERYGGGGWSRFFSPAGTPFPARSIPGDAAKSTLRSFIVMKPFEVESGKIAPAFGQLGGGTQFVTPVTLDILLKRGILWEVHP